MRIIYMGTPEFAVASLAALGEAGYPPVAVVTTPDKPAGRGQQVQRSPVGRYAEAQGWPLLQPEKLRASDFLAALRALEPDLMVVVAFRMLPEVVWRIPRLGTFNLHASLLPDYRGAAPINWAVINGESRSGVTTFMIDKEIDTGQILLQRETLIPPTWSAGDLHDALMVSGAGLVVETVQGLEAGRLVPQPQQEAAFRHAAPKIFREHCLIQWTQPALAVHNHIRGMSPYPAAWTLLDGKVMKVLASRLTETPADQPPGTLRVENRQLQVACADTWLELDQIQVEGKKRMPADEFLRGYKGPLTQVETPEGPF
ncbi:MAG: methionyl-tRNA formyltransferase [Bacteroidia bacterium]|nr:methionyl-tRNA formyltransferase [Bacteroidia bacterium]